MVKNITSSSVVSMPEQRISDLFSSFFGQLPTQITPLDAGGSSRKYFRLWNQDKSMSVIGTFSDNTSENSNFIALARIFRDAGACVPEIYAASDLCDAYLQQDLGDVSLYASLEAGNIKELVKSAIDNLIILQVTPGVEPSERKGLNLRQIKWDLNYFKYEFLKPSGVEFDEHALEDDFDLFSKIIRGIPSEQNGFMYRDFQSRNVMVHDGRSYLIDFQGGGYGPLLYDMVSFLWQARANFSDDFRTEMLNYYISSLSVAKGKEMSEMIKYLSVIRLLRNLQVLGAYGFRGLVEHKSQFVLPIPMALDSLRQLVFEGACDSFPELRKIALQLTTLDRFKINFVDNDKLTVNVFSFSYKKGYPEDLTGNGGGFMFDCRGMHNPGRYAEFKSQTGLDKGVIDFLEDRGEVFSFVENALGLLFPTVECYSRRGFSSLQVGFGCTGGQHRSVYCAQKTAEAIKSKFPDVRVVINHREQGINKEVL